VGGCWIEREKRDTNKKRREERRVTGLGTLLCLPQDARKRCEKKEKKEKNKEKKSVERET
jgi:hypothetical protein